MRNFKPFDNIRIPLERLEQYLIEQKVHDLSDLVIVIQARMGSQRLAGKVLLPLGGEGKTVLEILAKRLHVYFSKWNVPLVIATTTNIEDDAIAKKVREALPEIFLFRGSSLDVLNRYYQTCRSFGKKYCIRITADCPMMDPRLLHFGYAQIRGSATTYVSNVLHRTLPKGFDFELFSYTLLQEAYSHAEDDYQREHVTPYMYQEGGAACQLKNIEFELSSAFSDEEKKEIPAWRVTLDTKEDYLFLTELAGKIEKRFSDRSHPLTTVPAVEILPVMQAMKRANQEHRTL